MRTCIPAQTASPPHIFRITLYWNQIPFQDHLVLDNSPSRHSPKAMVYCPVNAVHFFTFVRLPMQCNLLFAFGLITSLSAADWKAVDPAELSEKKPQVESTAGAEILLWDI